MSLVRVLAVALVILGFWLAGYRAATAPTDQALYLGLGCWLLLVAAAVVLVWLRRVLRADIGALRPYQ
jgi:hypothetical protein